MDKDFKLPRIGQEQGRGERIKNYSEWTGAKPVSHGYDATEVDKDFHPVYATEAKSLAEAYVKKLRAHLACGIDKMIMSTADKELKDNMEKLLTPEERSHVYFEWFDVPQPRRVVEVDDMEETEYERARREGKGGFNNFLEGSTRKAADDDPFILDGDDPQKLLNPIL